jgi:hypothetical protein
MEIAEYEKKGEIKPKMEIRKKMLLDKKMIRNQGKTEYSRRKNHLRK